MIENYIFDLDGTIIDSREEIILCIKAAAEGFVVDTGIFDNIAVGKPIKTMLKPYFSDEATLNAVIERYRNIYDNKTEDSSTIFDGAEKALNLLKNKGKKIFLLTNKPYLPALRLLNKFSITDCFQNIYTIDKFTNGEKNKSERLKQIIKINSLNTDKTVLTGDSLEDIEAAKENNIMSVAALWGYEKNKKQLAEQADFWLNTFNFDSFDELTEKLKYLKQK